MLIVDLRMFGKKGEHEVNVKEALKMTAIWIGISLVFCVGVYFLYPTDPHGKAMEFLAGYLIEKSLSMDNLFVFLMLFSFFGVERKYQHEVLFWGIFGALVLRSIFIFAGAAMVERFEWVLGLFGLFLLYTGGKMFSHDDEQAAAPSNNIIVRWFKKVFPVTDKMHGEKFFIKGDKGAWVATPLFITLLVIETTDVAFAVDSIPAVFSVSRDPCLVLRSGCRGTAVQISEIRSWRYSNLRGSEDASCNERVYQWLRFVAWHGAEHAAYRGTDTTEPCNNLWSAGFVNGCLGSCIEETQHFLINTTDYTDFTEVSSADNQHL